MTRSPQTESRLGAATRISPTLATVGALVALTGSLMRLANDVVKSRTPAAPSPFPPTVEPFVSDLGLAIFVIGLGLLLWPFLLRTASPVILRIAGGLLVLSSVSILLSIPLFSLPILLQGGLPFLGPWTLVFVYLGALFFFVFAIVLWHLRRTLADRGLVGMGAGFAFGAAGLFVLALSLGPVVVTLLPGPLFGGAFVIAFFFGTLALGTAFFALGIGVAIWGLRRNGVGGPSGARWLYLAALTALVGVALGTVATGAVGAFALLRSTLYIPSPFLFALLPLSISLQLAARSLALLAFGLSLRYIVPLLRPEGLSIPVEHRV